MSDFKKFEAEKSDTVGFIVKYNWWGSDQDYVPRNKLYLAPTSIMLRDGYHSRESDWVEKRNFYWDKSFEETKIKVFENINIEEVSEVPDWVKKTKKQMKKDIEDYRDVLWKKSKLYKFLHFFSKD